MTCDRVSVIVFYSDDIYFSNCGKLLQHICFLRANERVLKFYFDVVTHKIDLNIWTRALVCYPGVYLRLCVGIV